jgi:hypothetical protein
LCWQNFFEVNEWCRDGGGMGKVLRLFLKILDFLSLIRDLNGLREFKDGMKIMKI